MSRLDKKRIFQREIVKNMAKRCFQLKMDQNTVSKTQHIFLREMVKIWQTLFLTHNGAKHSFQERVVIDEWIWWKTHFSARVWEHLAKRCFQLTMAQNTVLKMSCIPWLDLMQNASFREKWWKFDKTLFSTENGAKHSFQERVVFHEWIWCKTHFSARICEHLAKRCFQVTMAQNTVFKKELYCMSGFDAKHIFLQEMVKIWQNAVLNPKWSKIQFSRKSCNL